MLSTKSRSPEEEEESSTPGDGRADKCCHKIELLEYLKAHTRIFDVDFEWAKSQNIRIDFRYLKAVYESQQKSAGANDDEDEDDAEDDEDVDSDGDDQPGSRNRRRQSSKKTIAEKIIHLTPSKSTVRPPKSLQWLIHLHLRSAPERDFYHIYQRVHYGRAFQCCGNQNLMEKSLRVDDVVAIVIADFSSASRRHSFTEEELFHSYCVYFMRISYVTPTASIFSYVVTDINSRTMTIQYSGRIEPLDSSPSVEFNTPRSSFGSTATRYHHTSSGSEWKLGNRFLLQRENTH